MTNRPKSRLPLQGLILKRNKAKQDDVKATERYERNSSSKCAKRTAPLFRNFVDPNAALCKIKVGSGLKVETTSNALPNVPNILGLGKPRPLMLTTIQVKRTRKAFIC